MSKKLKVREAVIENRKARYDYFIEEELECGIVLKGNEVKSILEGSCSIKDAYCYISDGNLWVHNMHITAWRTSNSYDIDENRDKQLLARKMEIKKLASKVKEKGYTLVPLRVYKSKSGKYKVLVGLCVGKKNYDKRDSIKQRQIKRDIERMM